MPEILIESLDDPRLAPYRNLKRMNLTRWSGMFIAEGMRLVERLLESDFEVDSILVSEAHLRRLSPETIARTQVFIAPLKLLESIIGFQFHSGMLACGRRKQQVPLHDWLPPRPAPALIVGCPQTADPDNLGTIIRIAAAFGAQGIMTGKGAADPFSRRTLRISMGNAFYLPIYEAVDFQHEMQRMQQEFGFNVLASLLDPQAEPLAEIRRSHRTLLLLGNEDDGLAPELASLADQKVIIPMAEKIDSLNVGIAAGVMLYHLTQVAQPSNVS
ncbi:TrmH family RNA methyltransferase [Planctomicrobium sp. SH661]|uniref:TrmH family RNA methyltransferase n=1 Tax=Planctomicrobium sp. SH661 TaxID=3448124 RepID=UPI003F5C9D13